jgi:uncharacterized membrane protein
VGAVVLSMDDDRSASRRAYTSVDLLADWSALFGFLFMSTLPATTTEAITMIALTKKSILLALEQEKLIAHRQSLLKRLWRLEQREKRDKEARYDRDVNRY